MASSIEKFYDYEFINEYNGLRSPSTVHVTNTGLSRFFQRYLTEKIISVFEFEGIPETWAKNYFLYNLFLRGFIGIVRTDIYGVICQHCSLFGRDIFYQPTHFIIANPLLRGILQPRIGVEGALVKMQPDYCGAWDIVSFYADNMALCAEAAGMNVVNSKLSYVFVAENKAATQSFKKLYDEIASGNPAVFSDKNLFNADGTPAWAPFQQNLQNNYIAEKLLDTLIKWEVRFNTEVGIPNVNIAKASGVSDMEIEANTMETQTKAELWRDTIQDGLKIANNLFDDLNIKVRLKTDKQIITASEAGQNDDKIIKLKEVLKERRTA